MACRLGNGVDEALADELPLAFQRLALDSACSDQETLPQQAQTIESISGHTYIRKRISLTLFVKRLILWYARPG